MKTESTGFATWYGGDNQYIFKLEKKSGDTWQIKEGVWTKKKDDNNFITSTQIQSKTSTGGKWSWWFYMPKTPNPDDLQKWSDVFSKNGTAQAIYDINANKWNSNFSVTNSFAPGTGKIPKFEKVKTLDKFCQEEGSTRKQKPATNSDEEKKLNIYCLFTN